MEAIAPAVASSVLRPVLCGANGTLGLTVWARHSVAAYLAGGAGDTVAVTAPGASRLPFAVRILDSGAAAALRRLEPGDRASAAGGRISMPGLVIEVRRWWRPAPALPLVSSAGLRRSAAHLAALLPGDCLPEGSGAFSAALAAGDAAAALAAADQLIGAGPGSTPSGDDLLSGALVTMALLAPVNGDAAAVYQRVGRPLARHVVKVAPGRTTQLSVALLGHAAAGHPCGEVADVLRALSGRIPLGSTVQALLAVGHTSGADLAHGVLAAVCAVAESARAAA